MRKLSLMMMLAVLICAVSGCGNDPSATTSETAASGAAATAASAAATTAASAAVTTAAKPRDENMNYYDTKDGRFTFAVNKDYKEAQTEMLEDCEFSFSPDGKAAVGFMSLADFHYTAKGFTRGMIEDFKKKFDTVDWEETTVNNLPAARLTAKQTKNGSENTFEYYLVQYGNGDLFMAASGIPAASSYKIDVEEIFSNIEYKGAPLKTGDEQYQCDAFELTVPETFYVSNNENNTVGIKRNLADSQAEYTCKLSISKDSEKSAAKARDNYYDKRSSNKTTVSIEKSDAEIAGRKAYRIFNKIESSGTKLILDAYYFEEKGSVYSVSMVTDSEAYEQFKEECLPIIESMNVK